MATLIEKLSQMFGRGRSHGGLPIHISADAGDLPVKKRLSRTEQREATLVQLQRGYEEVVDTMKSLRLHMEEQSRRSDRMLNLMEGLPEVLRSIPESSERQTHVLQAMHQQMENQAQTTTQLSIALTELAGATGQQQQAMAGLAAQMQANRASSEALRDSLGMLCQTMDTMASASRANVDAVSAVAAQTRENQKQNESLYRKTHRQSTMMASVSWALALAALAVSGYVAVMVSRELSSRPLNPAPSASIAPTGSNTAANSDTSSNAMASVGLGAPIAPVSDLASAEAPAVEPDVIVEDPQSTPPPLELIDSAPAVEPTSPVEPQAAEFDALDVFLPTPVEPQAAQPEATEPPTE